MFIVLTAKWHLGPFTFDNRTNLTRVDYGAAVKLEITYIDKVACANLTLTFIAAPNFDFALRKL